MPGGAVRRRRVRVDGEGVMPLEEIWETWRDWPGNRARLWPTLALWAMIATIAWF